MNTRDQSPQFLPTDGLEQVRGAETNVKAFPRVS